MLQTIALRDMKKHFISFMYEVKCLIVIVQPPFFVGERYYINCFYLLTPLTVADKRKNVEWFQLWKPKLHS